MKSTSYLPQLTGYRAIATLIVFIAHASHRGFLPPILGDKLGEIGVMIFFLLSGYLMSYLYLQKEFNKKNALKYIVSRIGRIFPLYISVLLISYFVSIYIYPEFRYSFVNKSFSKSIFFISAPFELWTIPIEVQFYVMFVLIWFASSIIQNKNLVIILVGILIIIAKIVSLYKGIPIIHGIMSYAFAFYIGMVIDYYKVKFSNQKYAKIIGRASFILIFVNLPCLRMKFGGYFGWLDPLTWLILICCFVAILSSNDTLSFLKNKYLMFLGEISFGFYLFHVPILELIKKTYLNSITTLFISLILTIILASLSFFIFERPLNNFLKVRILNG
jgi:peptidoglycan/LPS O-acetylase OafA/YrhL